MNTHLLIFGASARAAAFAALRAGLRPWCADLFADADLRAHCPVVAVPPGRYPDGLVEIAAQAPPGPWMYTGALENHFDLIFQLARRRPLWGNRASALRGVRSPLNLLLLWRKAKVPCPDVRMGPVKLSRRGRWLLKPLRSSGGAGIRFWTGARTTKRGRKPFYLQEYIEGDPCAAVYVGAGRATRLLGVTQQLVGENWLHAAPFHYCGSIGPLRLGPGRQEAFERLGGVLASGGKTRGLFGVDCVLRDGVPLPIEVNPRYTASVEVLEYSLGVPALALHRQVFDPDAPDLPSPSAPVASSPVGKAVLFARASLVFPSDGPWLDTLRQPAAPEELPAFADIPPAGQAIRAGRPVLTFFARGGSLDACRDALRQTAQDLDRWLFG